MRLNAKLPDAEFVFTPPATAKPAPDWTLPGIAKPDLEGKPAPELKSAPAGRIALLYFTAPWCRPCQRDSVALEKLHAESPEVALIRINVDDPASDELVKQLPVNSVPTTIVIGKDWNIASYEAGTRGEAGLRSDLAKAGWKPVPPR